MKRTVVGGSRDDDLLGTTLQVETSLVGISEHTAGLDDVVSTSRSPGDVGGVPLGEDLDLLAVDDERALVLLVGITGEATVHGIVLEVVDHVIDGHEGLVDGHHVDLAALEGSAEDQTTDPAESVDTNLDVRHVVSAACAVCTTGRRRKTM
jgi:hypothetical protein